LVLVHPSSNGNQHEPERVQDSRHLVSSLSRAFQVASQARSSFSDHTGSCARQATDPSAGRSPSRGTSTPPTSVRSPTTSAATTDCSWATPV
jgi:hypothetical protein